jgi:hypothetical protein
MRLDRLKPGTTFMSQLRGRLYNGLGGLGGGLGGRLACGAAANAGADLDAMPF